MSKTLLVLAASRYQLDTIQSAKQLGLRVITTDNVASNPGHALADAAYGVDTTDDEGVLQIARNENIDGIISPCTDAAISTAAYVSEMLGLPGVPLKAARIVTDKAAFRRFLADHQLPVPEFHTLTSSDTMPDHLLGGGEPWIIKPDRSSGSKGVFIVRSQEELTARLPESRSFSSTGTVVAEQFLVGHQGTCEGILDGGEIRFSVVLDRQTAPAPFVTTIGHFVPATLPRCAEKRLLSRLHDVWSRLGVSDTTFDCDFVWAGDEIYLIEITPRLGGNCISRLLLDSTGFDLVDYAVRRACGLPAELPVKSLPCHAAVVLLGVWNCGELRYSENEVRRLRAEPWLRSLSFDFPQGTPVQPFINGRHRVGEAFIRADNRSELEQHVAEFHQRLALTSIA